MELLKAVKRRSVWSEVAYVLLNVLLAAVILVIVRTTGSAGLAIGLVLLSKWRILAVRPRYWFAHVQSNMVDIIVSISFVTILYAASGAFFVQLVTTVLYILWLLLLKPRSKRSAVVAQAAVGMFVSLTATAIVSANWDPTFVVLAYWIIGASTARHTLLAYGEHAHVTLLSLLWGFVVAELGWLTYHWGIAYSLFDAGLIQLPQSAIIIFLISFLAERTYASYTKWEKIRLNDMILPTLLTLSVIAILLAFFNSASNSLS